uniref:Peroxiredoxin-like 2A n=1 Tax=Meloidogyne javanica TaxID=6303 RepID=A0A915MS72_MELJA
AEEIFNANPTLVMAVRRPGCSFCRKEASQICSLSKQLEEKGVKVIGVVHETLGVEDFRPFLGCSDALYFDPEKKFFGPEQRWLPLWMGFLRLSTYINTYKTKKAGFVGNLDGIYLINKDKMLFAHLEKEWGDEPETQQLLDAISAI